jgi:hypothetical protein
MIYLISLIASLNIVLLAEVVLHNIKIQEKEGKQIGYGRTLIIYVIFVIIIWAIIFGVGRYFDLS